MKVHKGTKHKETQQPEQFRAESLDNSLILTPVKEPREEYLEETDFPVQLDGARDKDLEESPKETKHTDEEKESQTDIFLRLNPNGGVLDSFLDILYNNPPPTVYHPVLGIGEHHSTNNYIELKTNNHRKAYCYRFGNGELVDV